MPACPRCSAETSFNQRFCSACGAVLPASSQLGTVAMAAAASVNSISAPDAGRFAPGTILAQRYRVVGAIGRGGMGEVYRAYDIVLGQEVALKFLPASLDTTSAVLERFRTEVRLARQVSHPNVCRVYDIGEAEGAPFLSMEYVDGEDLASLLRRIGRLPADKALDISRRLCAGMAAAHEKGVLHRDLKPGNVMLDGRGEVRITDFGLAALAGSVTGEAARQGTPAYMAPEQLAGREVTVKSDLYALGLVLYELFTGKRAFEAASVAELARLRQESVPASIASVAQDVHPAVERAILRCLAPDPKQRPASAKAVALALTGGDPVAAAIAAGETPSPEAVANADDAEMPRQATLAAALGAAVVAVILMAVLGRSAPVTARVPMENSPEALASLARERARHLGYADRGGDSAMQFESNTWYVEWARRHLDGKRFEALLPTARPAAVLFWYRQSPCVLEPDMAAAWVSWDGPPMNRTGMWRALLDSEGRLLRFEAVPRELENASAAAPMDWAPLFAAAGLDAAQFRPAEPEWTPAMAFDLRKAWTGAWPGAPEIPLRLEAAAWRGKVVSFRTIEPWTKAARDEGLTVHWADMLMGFVIVVLVAPVAGYMAWRNVKANRGDRAGALSLGAAVFLLFTAANLLTMDHIAGTTELQRVVTAIGIELVGGAICSLLYLALEPYVRRRGPRLLITWTRLLRGDWRDPALAGGVLLGVVCGLAYIALQMAAELVKTRRGEPPWLPWPLMWNALSGARQLVGHVPGTVGSAVLYTLVGVFLFFLLRMLLRHDLPAALVLVAIYTWPYVLSEPLTGAIAAGIFFAGWLFLSLRFGLPAGVAYFATGQPWTPLLDMNPSRWYFGFWLVRLAIPLLVTGVAFRIAMGKRKLIGDETLR